MSNFNNKWVSRNDYFEHGGKLFECDYLFNYDGLNDRQRLKIANKEIGTAEIYQKLIMNE